MMEIIIMVDMLAAILYEFINASITGTNLKLYVVIYRMMSQIL